MSSYSQSIFLVEEIATIVAKVNTKLTANGFDKTVQYLYGHPLEIVNRLMEFSKSEEYKDKQFPLIALLLDVTVTVGEAVGYFGTGRVNFIICTNTDPNYTAPERLVKNFKPILHPIKDAFIREVEYHRAFTRAGELKYTAIDRYYWGKQGLYGNNANVFNDYIDAIEIQNLQLTFKNKIC